MPRAVILSAIVVCVLLGLGFAAASSMEYTKALSTVLAADSPSRHWADTAFLMIHEPIRADLVRLNAALQEPYFTGTSDWKVRLNALNRKRGRVHFVHERVLTSPCSLV